MQQKILTTFISVLLLTSVAVGFLTPIFLAPHPAYAADTDQTYKNAKSIDEQVDKLGKACGGFMSLVTLNLNCIILNTIWLVDKFLAGTVLYFSTQLLDWSVAYNLVSISGSNNTFVQVGWGLIRDIANLFFIFILLWIALATIFDFSGYGGKDLLYKLIIAALLVNFSLAIGGFVINVSNALARAFYNPIKSASLGDSLLAFTHIQEATITKFTPFDKAGYCNNYALEQVKHTIPGEKVGTSIWNSQYDNFRNACFNQEGAAEEIARNKAIEPAVTNAIYQALWLIVIIPMLAFILAAAAIFLLMRYLMLTMLLIFGPLVFLFSVLPITRGYIGQWWSKLFQWSFFAPAFFFLLFLTVEGFTRLARLNAQTNGKGFPGVSFDMILFVILMILNLQLAQKMGIYGASTVVGFGKKQTDRLKGAVRGAAYRGYVRSVGAPAGRALTESGLGQAMARSWVTRGMLSPALKIQEEKDRLDKERAKQVERAAALSPDLGAARLKGESMGVKAAYAKTASSESMRKLLGAMSEEEQNRFMTSVHASAGTYGLDPDDFSKRVGEAMAKDGRGLTLRMMAKTGKAEKDPLFKEEMTKYLDSLNDAELAATVTAGSLGANKKGETNQYAMEYFLKNFKNDPRIGRAYFGTPEKLKQMQGFIQTTAELNPAYSAMNTTGMTPDQVAKAQVEYVAKIMEDRDHGNREGASALRAGPLIRLIAGTKGTKEFVKIPDALTPAPSHAWTGSAGKTLSSSLYASGGEGERRWQDTGHAIPWLHIDMSGKVKADVPEDIAPGKYTTDVEVIDENGNKEKSTIEITVKATPVQQNIDRNKAYNVKLPGAGKPGHTWTLKSGNLPPVVDPANPTAIMKITPDGRLNGTIDSTRTKPGDFFAGEIEVDDGAGHKGIVKVDFSVRQ